MIVVECPTEMETRALAARLASLCRPGDLIVLSGGLGVGKTTFVGGLADGLGVEEAITSPTFVLMRSYSSGFLPFVHVDVYRIGSALEFDDLEVFELGREGVVAIEWGEVIGMVLPPDRLHVDLQVTGETARTVTLRPLGEWNARPIAEVAGP
jgi:tRNA threonylcarbamoyladenosine biosynthesis protein TsaE